MYWVYFRKNGSFAKIILIFGRQHVENKEYDMDRLYMRVGRKSIEG